MWKYFRASEQDAFSQIYKLKAELPNYYFKDGKRRDQNGIWILRTLDKTPYGEFVESKQFKGDVFYPPAELPADKQKWLDQFVLQSALNQHKLVVTLMCGIQLKIVPATLEPRNVVFCFGNDIVEQDSAYSQATTYGRLAYSISEEVQKSKNIVINQDTMQLVKIALSKSYDIPFDVWNWLNIVSAQDIYTIVTAAMGVDPSILEDELKKNGLDLPLEATMPGTN